MNRFLIILLAFTVPAATSCVSSRKFKALEASNNSCIEERALLSINLEVSQEKVAGYTRANNQLREDTARLGRHQRATNENLQSLIRTNRQLLEQNENLTAGHAIETQQALNRLKQAQDDLLRREDLLRQQEHSANELLRTVSAKEARVNELEAILKQQEQAVIGLRKTISDALLGFEGNGLTVNIRQGKVYVSLEESLLFASGSATVDRRGESALRELAKALERNPDINIMIEGHTDDVPLRAGGAIRDNWDLSVLRATSIVRTLQRHGNINPQRIIAAGRGEFSPVDPARTTEARRKNRRTEIILTPNLDPLFQILGMP
jgi:chemotaxis protein MotB